jgi:hypothetical protein
MATTVSLKPNAVEISGSTSGTTTLQATAVAGTTTLTLPAATDTLVGRATTDTLTNKTLTGAVMNGTLGATTPSTVAATTILASSTLGVGSGTTGLGKIEIQQSSTTAGLWVQSGGTTNSYVIADFRNGSNVSALKIFGNARSTFVTTVGVGEATPSTSGAGITFPATQSASTDANTLDDYEEGTWTPSFARSTGGAITATLSTNTGKYTKIGNLVTVSIITIIDSVSSQGSGESEIRGLPFPPADNALGAGSVGRNDTFTTDVVHNCWIWSDSRIIFSSNVNSASATAVDWKSGTMNLTMTYSV